MNEQAVSPQKKSLPFGLVLLAIVVGFFIYRASEGAGRGGIVGLVKSPRLILMQDAIDLEIPAGKVFGWRWEATADQPSCQLNGHIEVTAGGNKDVQVFVVTADDYTNLLNGHDATALFQSAKTSALTLDVETSQPGPKVLAISNGFSLLTKKLVSVTGVRVTCQ